MNSEPSADAAHTDAELWITMTYIERKSDPSEQEWEVLRHEAKPCLVSLVYILVFIGGGLAFLLWLLLSWIIGFWSESAASYAGYAAIGIGLFVGVRASISFLRFNKIRQAAAIEYLKEGKIDEIEVRASAVSKILLLNDNEPILCFQVDAGRLLYMQGQYMYDPHVYDQLDEEDQHNEMSVNGMNGAKAFPNDHFIIRRLPRHGRVLTITLLGHALEWEREVDVLKPEYDFPDSILIEGSLDSLSESLEEAHKAFGRTGGAEADLCTGVEDV